MKRSPSSARVLVASDSLSDAQQLLSLLGDHFEQIRATTDPKHAVTDFEGFAPDVVVLAFNEIEKAQRYYLGLYRLGEMVHAHPHRTVLLCTKNEVAAAFELCKNQYFDDYVFFWPPPQDGLRLPMSIWLAAREMTAAQAVGPRRAELISHAKHLGALDQAVTHGLVRGEAQLATARASLLQLEREIAAGSDEFSSRLLREQAGGAIEIKYADGLVHELERFKAQQVAHTRTARAAVLDPMDEWTRSFKGEVEPPLAGALVLAENVRKLKPIVLGVDDDEFIRELLTQFLKADSYELRLAATSFDALRELRGSRPDVILMDIRLPGVDGLALTQRLKATTDFADIPIIMMTGDARRETLVSSLDVGALDFIVKPFARAALIGKLDKALARSGVLALEADVHGGDLRQGLR